MEADIKFVHTHNDHNVMIYPEQKEMFKQWAETKNLEVVQFSRPEVA